MTLSLSGYRVELRQDPQYWLNVGNYRNLIGQFVPTTEVLVAGVRRDRVRYVRKLLDDLTSLLSFVSLSGVRFYGFEYPVNSGQWQRWASHGAFQRSWPMVANISGASVTDFVTQTWPTFRQLKSRRRLGTAINYIVEGDRPGQRLELKLLCAFVTLENLKDTYARTVGIPFQRGRYRNARGDPISFEALLSEMLSAVGVRRGIKRIVRLRNELIHSSVSRLPIRSQMALYVASMQLLEEYVLRLLGYRGLYASYAGPVRKI